MKVRMKVTVSGARNGTRWPAAGQEVDLPDREAADLCAANLAEPVRSDKVERAVVEEPVEKRDDESSPEPLTTDSVQSRRRGK